MLHQFIEKRRSPVLFSQQLIGKDKLISLFEAARWAPSSYNIQPWRYIVSSKEYPEDFNRLYECLAEGNKEWTKNVPVLGLSIAETTSEYKFRTNKYAMHDVGLSMANLIFQGMSMGIYVHIMGGFDKELSREKLQIPGRFDPVAMFALGYPAKSTDNFSKELVKRENQRRRRKNINEFLFYGKWENNI